MAPNENKTNKTGTNKLELDNLYLIDILEAIKPADEFDIFYHSDTSYLAENLLYD